MEYLYFSRVNIEGLIIWLVFNIYLYKMWLFYGNMY